MREGRRISGKGRIGELPEIASGIPQIRELNRGALVMRDTHGKPKKLQDRRAGSRRPASSRTIRCRDAMQGPPMPSVRPRPCTPSARAARSSSGLSRGLARDRITASDQALRVKTTADRTKAAAKMRERRASGAAFRSRDGGPGRSMISCSAASGTETPLSVQSWRYAGSSGHGSPCFG